MDELRACPFCKGYVDWNSCQFSSKGKTIFAKCTQCGTLFRVLEHIFQRRPLEDALRAQRDELLETLGQIEAWSRAYPLDIFPEPDMKKVRALLEAGGITLDAVSAYAMRHVVETVADMARVAIEKAGG